MDADVVREFGMEGGGEDVALAQAHHVTIDFGFDRSLGADRHHVGPRMNTSGKSAMRCGSSAWPKSAMAWKLPS